MGVKNNIIKVFLKYTSTVFFVFMTGFSPLFSVSVAEKAREKFLENKEYIVAMDIAMQNFGTDEYKNSYTEIKDGFMQGMQLYLVGNYTKAYEQLVDTQIKLEKIYESMSIDYIERTSLMLQEVAKKYVDINIKFDKNTDLVRRFQLDREAPKEERSYDPNEYHLVYDKRDIISNLKVGYSKLGDAQRIRQDAIDLAKYYEEGKPLDPRVRASRIESYYITINLCREAKQNVIRIYQLMNRNDIYTVQTEFRGNRFAKEEHLPAVFDPRIPDEYKKDASDALNLIHEEEIRVKLENKGYESSKKEGKKNASTQPAAQQPAETTKPAATKP